MQSIARSAEYWLQQHNVEAVWCWLPNFAQVCEGTHTVTALGNDAMAVNIVVDNEAQQRVAGDMSSLVQLTALGRFLTAYRRSEVRGYR